VTAWRHGCKLGTVTNAPPEPVIGWRLWRLRHDRLHSWAVDHVWELGPAEAVCRPLGGLRMGNLLIPTRRACQNPPGKGCRCGFWALWDPAACVTWARSEPARERPQVVLGLIAGWGTVALHGDEGFRAQHASILCLFSDEVDDQVLDPLTKWPRWQIWCRRRIHRERPAPERPASLQRAAEAHGVPLMPLAEAVRRGVLSEFGLTAERIRRVEAGLGQS
jgi:hypothetical protein